MRLLARAIASSVGRSTRRFSAFLSAPPWGVGRLDLEWDLWSRRGKEKDVNTASVKEGMGRIRLNPDPTCSTPRLGCRSSLSEHVRGWALVPKCPSWVREYGIQSRASSPNLLPRRPQSFAAPPPGAPS
eukprot:8778810-Pyramimonas_sp.AAC.1